MYNPSSTHADEFIDHAEVLETLAEAARESRNPQRVTAILDKAALCKGLSHREAATLLECDDPALEHRLYALAGEMMDRVEKFLASYDDMGAALDKAMKAYGEAGKKLAPNGQSITTTAIKLAKMGARKGKHIERALQDVDEIGALEEGDRE